MDDTMDKKTDLEEAEKVALEELLGDEAEDEDEDEEDDEDEEVLTRSEKRARARRRRRVGRVLNALAIIIILGLCAYIGVMMWFGSTDPVVSFFTGATPTPLPTATPAPTPKPTPVPVVVVEATPEPTAEPEPEVTPAPTPTPVPIESGVEEIDAEAINDKVKPGRADLQLSENVWQNGQQTQSFERENEISMNQGELYADLEGVTTFRGNNYRDSASAGALMDTPTSLTVAYTVETTANGNQKGLGWTGQPLLVKWDDATRQNMNLYADKKAKSGLVEVIVATLGGEVLFFDLDDGAPTRDAIQVGASVKGTPAVDPRGYPLLYVGQGSKSNNPGVDSGMRIYSLIDGKELYFINNQDNAAVVNYPLCDSSPLVDAETDTLFWPSENGVVYCVDLNSDYDEETGTLSIRPSVDKYRYVNPMTMYAGFESSMAIYNHYGYLADNYGLVTCVNLNTLKALWAVKTGDDTDATIVIEEDDDGVWLYTGTLFSVGKNARTIIRRIDALTGKTNWSMDLNITVKGTGGLFATPALGKNGLSDLVFMNVAHTNEGGTLLALDKGTGDVVWKASLGTHSISSPVAVYDEMGNGYIVQALSSGKVQIYDGRSGELITETALDGEIEASPAVFDNVIVIGTKAGHVYGIRID